MRRLVAAGACAEAADQRDPDHFSIAFEAEHIGYQQQLGFFLEVRVSSALIPRQMYSAVGVLKLSRQFVQQSRCSGQSSQGEGFLNARRHARIVFEVSEHFAADGVLRGNLTMLDETHQADLKVVVNKQAGIRLGIAKKLWAFQRVLPFYAVSGAWTMVANNMVGDEVTLRFEFEATAIKMLYSDT